MFKGGFCWNFTSDIIMKIMRIISTLVKTTIVAVVIIINVLMYSLVPSAIFYSHHFTCKVIWNLWPLDRFLKMVMRKASEFNSTKWNTMKWSQGTNSSFQSLKEHEWKLVLSPFLTFQALGLPSFSRLSLATLLQPLYFVTYSFSSSAKFFPSHCLTRSLRILYGLFGITKGFSGSDAL